MSMTIRLRPPGRAQSRPRARRRSRSSSLPARSRPAVRGRAAPARGAREADRRGEVRRRPQVFPGAWFGATIRSTDAHARFVALDLDPAFDWSKVVVVTAPDIPGDNIVSLISDDQPVLVPVGGEIRHQAEPLALLAAQDRATLRAARAAVTARTETLPAIFDPRLSEHVFAHYDIASGDLERGSPRPTASSRARIASATRSSSTSRTTR